MSDNPVPPAELVARCEWCRDEVWSDDAYLESSGYVWHQECEADMSVLLGQAKKYEGGALIDGQEGGQ